MGAFGIIYIFEHYESKVILINLFHCSHVSHGTVLKALQQYGQEL